MTAGLNRTPPRILLATLSALMVGALLGSTGPAAEGQAILPALASFDTGTGEWHLMSPEDTDHRFFFGTPGEQPVMGDWDCDGVETVATYDRRKGHVHLRNSNATGPSEASFYLGISGDIAMAGDWNGDGCDTISVYRATNGSVYISNALGTRIADKRYYFGVPGDRPFAGDFDGDGVDTVGVWRESTQHVYLRNDHSTGVAQAEVEIAEQVDAVLVDDWDSDGRETMAIFQEAGRRILISTEEDPASFVEEVNLRGQGRVPVTGRFNPRKSPEATSTTTTALRCTDCAPPPPTTTTTTPPPTTTTTTTPPPTTTTTTTPPPTTTTTTTPPPTTTTTTTPPPTTTTTTPPPTTTVGWIDVRDFGVVGNGSVDDTASIQAVLDSAQSGDTIFFPNVSPGFYRITGSIRINKPLTIRGENGNSEVRQTSMGDHQSFVIQSSDVTITGMRIVGYEYGPRNGANGIDTSGGSVSSRLSNITITENWIQRFSGRGINLTFVDDFVVTDNHVEDVHYGGIYVVSGRRGYIGRNQIVDIGDPETGAAFGNAYPIVVSANPANGYPLNEDVIIQSNTVEHAPEWTGIMNHGGTRILVVDNSVRGADFAYANTYAGVGSDNSAFINNYAQDAPREGLWLVGPQSPRTQGASAIGNVFVNTAPMVVYDQENATATWNTFTQASNLHALQVARTGSSYVDHNTINGTLRISSTSASPAVTPPAPTNLTASRLNASTVSLSWNYNKTTVHDSFYIESRTNNGTWQRVAYRPPHDGTWDFTAPTNPNWNRFNPSTHTVTGLNNTQTHEFRIRANNGDTFSNWSNTTNS